MNAGTRPGETSLILSAMVFRQGIDRQEFSDEQHLPVTAKCCKIKGNTDENVSLALTGFSLRGSSFL